MTIVTRDALDSLNQWKATSIYDTEKLKKAGINVAMIEVWLDPKETDMKGYVLADESKRAFAKKVPYIVAISKIMEMYGLQERQLNDLGRHVVKWLSPAHSNFIVQVHEKLWQPMLDNSVRIIAEHKQYLAMTKGIDSKSVKAMDIMEKANRQRAKEKEIANAKAVLELHKDEEWDSTVDTTATIENQAKIDSSNSIGNDIPSWEHRAESIGKIMEEKEDLEANTIGDGEQWGIDWVGLVGGWTTWPLARRWSNDSTDNATEENGNSEPRAESRMGNSDGDIETDWTGIPEQVVGN